MKQDFSFTIYPVRDRNGLTGQFKCMYKRGFKDRWHIYRENGKDKFFASWDSAQMFLLKKVNHNFVEFLLHFSGELMPLGEHSGVFAKGPAHKH
jgi:hypothetical protein